MKRGLLAAVLMLGLASPVLARTIEERLISGLKSQGYTILEDGFTWLGRLRIVAENAQYHREIVVNPETGEVLRDYVVLLADMPGIPSAGPNSAAVASTQHDSGSGSDGSTTRMMTSSDPVTTLAPEPQTGAGLMPDENAVAPTDDLTLAPPVISAGEDAP